MCLSAEQLSIVLTISVDHELWVLSQLNLLSLCGQQMGESSVWEGNCPGGYAAKTCEWLIMTVV